MSGILWLASYPKSGNTWFRAFLTNLLREDDEPADINDLVGGPIAGSREPFDEAVGYDSGDLTEDEIDRLRPEVYCHLAATRTEDPLFMKVHDAYTLLPDGRPLFPPEATRGVLYLIRNPLDVCVSFAHHAGHHDIDRMIAAMAHPGKAFADERDRQAHQLRQQLRTWREHVLSWTEAPGLRVHVVRYEDMKAAPVETFAEAAAFAGLPHDRAQVEAALARTTFEAMKRQEEERGFREKAPSAPSFFRRGEVGSWRDVLTPAQAARIIETHADAMRRVGYLTEDGEPVF